MEKMKVTGGGLCAAPTDADLYAYNMRGHTRDKALNRIGEFVRRCVEQTDRDINNTLRRISPVTAHELSEELGYLVDVKCTPIRDSDRNLCSFEVLTTVSGAKVASIFVDSTNTAHSVYYPCVSLSMKEVARSLRQAVPSAS